MNNPLKISEDVFYSACNEGLMVYHKSGSAFYELNYVGMKVWEKLTNQMSVDNIVNDLATEYDEEPEEIRKEVLSFVNTLLNLNLAS